MDGLYNSANTSQPLPSVPAAPPALPAPPAPPALPVQVEINGDDVFVDEVDQAKAISDVIINIKENLGMEALGTLPTQLRMKIAAIIKYVMKKIEEEEAQGADGAQEVAPDQEDRSYVGGKKKLKKPKRGGAMDMNKVLNTDGMIKDDTAMNETLSRDAALGGFQHAAFSAGQSSGYSSIGNLPASEVNGILPYLGTGGKGKDKKKRTRA